MLGLSKEQEEDFFRKAAGLLKKNGLECFTVDRSRITVVNKPEKKVKIYLRPFTKKNISRHQLSTLKKIPEVKILNDRYTKTKAGQEKLIYENACLLFNMEDDENEE